VSLRKSAAARWPRLHGNSLSDARPVHACKSTFELKTSASQLQQPF
jgi:hypothetical protein